MVTMPIIYQQLIEFQGRQEGPPPPGSLVDPLPVRTPTLYSDHTLCIPCTVSIS